MTKFTRVNPILAALALVAPITAGAVENGEVGMITQAMGNVTYRSTGGKEKPLMAFMKMQFGDKLTLAKDAKTQMVYFRSGRQETWRGAAQIEVGESESHATGPAAQPEIKQLPALVIQQLTRAPSVVSDLKTRSGMVLVRALPMREKMRELDDTYAAMRKEAAADDITPELYKLAGLHELKLYHDMRAVLEEMRQRQPDNPEVKAAYDQYNKVTNPPEGRGTP